MFMRIVLFVLFFFHCFFSSAYAKEEVFTLDNCFHLAIARSTTLSYNIDQLNQVEQQIKEAQSNFMPVFSFQASTMRQDLGDNPLGNSLSPKTSTITNLNLNLNQNLFQGFKDLATYRQKIDQKEMTEWIKKQSIVQIYKDTAKAFYNILIYQSDLSHYKEQIQTTEKRKKELLMSKRSGRARESDVVSVESAIANLEVNLVNIQGLLVAWQETLAYLTGLPYDVNLSLSTPLPSNLNDINYWLENINQRPDVQQSEINTQVSLEGIHVAEAGYFPAVSLNTNYYLSRPQMYSGINWDVTLTLNFPLFSGGITKAQVSEASVVKHSNEVLLQQTKEKSIQTVRTLYRTVKLDLDQINRLFKSYDLSHRSFDLMHRENQLGNATNTDVLTALTNWQESKRNLDRFKMTTLYDYSKLLVESAKITLDENDKKGDLK